MKPLDLHDLINRPGYGTARRAGLLEPTPVDRLSRSVLHLNNIGHYDIADDIDAAIEQLTKGETA